MFTTYCRRPLVLFLASFVCALVPSIAGADHSWGPYHWARTSNPFTLKLGDNVSSAWDTYLATTSTDWTASSVLDTLIVAGEAGNPKRCRATSGRVEVCSTAYGNNGWLGLAQIWISSSHIVQGTTKLNDTYFNTAKYNTPAWRNLVMCQEVGHTLGLDHQDENFSNPPLGTCMDYSNDPDPNQHPNQHDYDQLVAIYNHPDTTTTVSQTSAQSTLPPFTAGRRTSPHPAPGQTSAQGALPPAMTDIDFETPAQWGRLIKTSHGGRTAVYELEFSGGHKILTFVIWAEGEERGRR
ncbi:MAG: hypothetical protein AABM33_06605 [Pseudomonadota bacterium]